jgi:sodium/hydrogen exchanger 3
MRALQQEVAVQLTDEALSGLLLGYLLTFAFGLILGYYTFHIWRVTWFPEAGVPIVVGIIASAVVSFGTDVQFTQDSAFDPTFFILGLLPPIIFNAGWTMNQAHFGRYAANIMTFAFAGTMISVVLVAVAVFCGSEWGWYGSLRVSFAECLTFGALISATDPVTTLAVFTELNVDIQVFYLVFGESVLNDAVAMVLFTSFAEFVENGIDVVELSKAAGNFVVVFSMSTVLGIVWGCLSALLFKHVDLTRHRVTEMTVFVLMSYVPFLCADALGMSGIVTIMFCGMTAKHYTHNNLAGPVSQETATTMIGFVAYLAESVVFFSLGLSFFGLHLQYNWALIAVAASSCLVARACHVYPLSWFLNRRSKDDKIPLNTQHMLWFSGLRGAMAYCLSIIFPGPNREVWKCTTMAIALASVLLMGGGTQHALDRLQIPYGDAVDAEEDTASKGRYGLVSLGSKGSGFRQKLHMWDLNVLTPFFVKPGNLNLTKGNQEQREIELLPPAGLGPSVTSL